MSIRLWVAFDIPRLLWLSNIRSNNTRSTIQFHKKTLPMYMSPSIKYFWGFERFFHNFSSQTAWRDNFFIVWSILFTLFKTPQVFGLSWPEWAQAGNLPSLLTLKVPLYLHKDKLDVMKTFITLFFSLWGLKTNSLCWLYCWLRVTSKEKIKFVKFHFFVCDSSQMKDTIE